MCWEFLPKKDIQGQAENDIPSFPILLAGFLKFLNQSINHPFILMFNQFQQYVRKENKNISFPVLF